MKNRFNIPFIALLLSLFFSLNGWSQSENNPPDSDYEDVICNGWIYDYLSGFTDSCFLDTTLVDTNLVIVVDLSGNGVDTLLELDVWIYFFQIREVCYDLSFGVVETENDFTHYYSQSVVNSNSALSTELDGSINGVPLPADTILAIMADADLLSDFFSTGYEFTTFVDCESMIDFVCVNDSICYNALNSISIADSLQNEELMTDTIGFPPDDNWAFIELWNFTDQNQAGCNDNSARINPCDTCEAQLITGVEILPDTCEESTLSIAVHGQFDYEFCSLNSIEVDYDPFFNIINLTVDYARADSLEFCTECGTEYGDTLFLGNLDDDTYALNVINSFNDSLLFSTTFEVINCFTPFCPVPDASSLTTQSITDTSAILSYTGSTFYSAFAWRIRDCGQGVWIDLGTTAQPQIEVDILEADTEYCWQVSGICPQSSSFWSAEVTFLTSPSAPNIPVLISPPNGSVDVPLSVNFSWTDVPNAETYRIQVSSDNSFINLIADQDGWAGTSFAYSLQGYGATYYWRVKAMNTTGESDWSEVWSFTTVMSVPGQPVLVDPPNGSLDMPVMGYLAWAGHPDEPGVGNYNPEVFTAVQGSWGIYLTHPSPVWGRT